MSINNEDPPPDLRERAERFLAENPRYVQAYDERDLRELIEELHIFQAELEVQNEELRRAQQELTQSRDRYYEIYDFAPVGYCTLNRAGAIEEINVAGAELLGQPRGHLLKKRFTRFVHLDYQDRVLALLRRAIADSKRHECLARLATDKPAGERVVQIVAVGRKTPAGAYAGTFLTLSDITKLDAQQHGLEQLNKTLSERTSDAEQSAARVRELSSALGRAEERERHRLASELHDYLAQLLVVGGMMINALRKKSPEHVHGDLQGIQDVLQQARDYTRTLIAELSPPALYQGGLVAALQGLGMAMSKHGLSVEVQEYDVSEVPPFEAAVIYRCTRELLFNILKHARTDRAWIDLRCADGTLEVRVEDRGCGFSETTDKPGESIGLLSLQERLVSVQGALELDSASGHGTTAIMRVPLPAPERQAEVAQRPHVKSSAPHSSGVLNIVVVDDHAMVRQGLCRGLEECPGMHVVGEACDGVEAVEQAHRLHPDVIIMDINMPRMNGIEATREITSQLPGVTVIGISFREDEAAKEAMTAAGAVTLISKGAPISEICDVALAACRSAG